MIRRTQKEVITKKKQCGHGVKHKHAAIVSRKKTHGYTNGEACHFALSCKK